MHVILFDIDGTLLHSGGAGQAGIERALELAFGVTAPTDGIPTAGRTDRAIGGDLIRFHGLDDAEATHAQLQETYLEVLPSELTSRNGGVYPGVRELLTRLSQRDDVRLGLLTGNYREAAWQKLRHYRIAEHFSFGGFGDEHADRDDVARQALAAAAEHHAPQAIDHKKLWSSVTLRPTFAAAERSGRESSRSRLACIRLKNSSSRSRIIFLRTSRMWSWCLRCGRN